MNKISIITINFNNKAGLERTMQSVISQDADDVEYLVIDGGSTDGSISVIEENASNIHYWVSEKDDGIYNAMNKGIRKATGSYLLFLNSGDELLNPTVITQFQKEGFTEDIVYGNLQYNDAAQRVWLAPETLNFEFFTESSLAHPSTFIKRDLFQRFGEYDEQLKIVADWKFFILAICRHKVTYKKIDLCVSLFDMTGISNSEATEQRHQSERLQVLLHDFGDLLYLDYTAKKALVSHFKSSRLISLVRRIGLLSKIDLDQ